MCELGVNAAGQAHAGVGEAVVRVQGRRGLCGRKSPFPLPSAPSPALLGPSTFIWFVQSPFILQPEKLRQACTRDMLLCGRAPGEPSVNSSGHQRCPPGPEGRPRGQAALGSGDLGLLGAFRASCHVLRPPRSRVSRGPVLTRLSEAGSARVG